MWLVVRSDELSDIVSVMRHRSYYLHAVFFIIERHELLFLALHQKRAIKNLVNMNTKMSAAATYHFNMHLLLLLALIDYVFKLKLFVDEHACGVLIARFVDTNIIIDSCADLSAFLVSTFRDWETWLICLLAVRICCYRLVSPAHADRLRLDLRLPLVVLARSWVVKHDGINVVHLVGLCCIDGGYGRILILCILLDLNVAVSSLRGLLVLLLLLYEVSILVIRFVVHISFSNCKLVCLFFSQTFDSRQNLSLLMINTKIHSTSLKTQISLIS